MAKAKGYKYFLYSYEYLKSRNIIEEKVGKTFVCGTVIVDGSLKEFNIISDTPTINRYPDARIIAEGDIENIKYTDISTKPRRS